MEYINKIKEFSSYPNFSGMIDKYGRPLYDGNLVKLYVRRCSTNPWWGKSSKYDGFKNEYFIQKKIVKQLNKKGFFEFTLIDTDLTKEMVEEICAPKGNEKTQHIIDQLNYNQNYIELWCDKIDLRNCKKGDRLLSSQGAILEYISPTPFKGHTYLDHVVRYIEDKDGKSFGDECYGTRTNDGLTYINNRNPETDHDIIKILFF